MPILVPSVLQLRFQPLADSLLKNQLVSNPNPLFGGGFYVEFIYVNMTSKVLVIELQVLQQLLDVGDKRQSEVQLLAPLGMG